MLKQEAVIREILCQFLYNNDIIDQQQISQSLNVSIGLVNKVISRLQSMGAVSKTGRRYSVTSFRKILMFWSSLRNLQRDILYSTRVSDRLEKLNAIYLMVLSLLLTRHLIIDSMRLLLTTVKYGSMSKMK